MTVHFVEVFENGKDRFREGFLLRIGAFVSHFHGDEGLSLEIRHMSDRAV